MDSAVEELTRFIDTVKKADAKEKAGGPGNTLAGQDNSLLPPDFIGKILHARLSRARQRHAVPTQRNAGDRALRQPPRLRQRDPRSGRGGAERGRKILRGDRKSTRLNSSHYCATRMPSAA